DENTIFQLASVTKTLTAAAAAAVVDEGKLDWDKPIFNYLPEFVGYDPYMTRWLTERDLLAQRAGWPAFTGDQLDSFGYDRAEILLRLRFFKPRYSLREAAQYSNPGFFVAGEVAARCAKQSQKFSSAAWCLRLISPICRRSATKQVFTMDSVWEVMITQGIRSSKKAALSQVCGRLWCWCPTRTPALSFSRTSISPPFPKRYAPIF